MGLSQPTLHPVCGLYVRFRANLTYITIQLPSLAGPGGGFDVPTKKCPPDRGSSECVTGIPASTRYPSPPTQNNNFAQSTYPLHQKADSRSSIVYPPTPPLQAADYKSNSKPAPTQNNSNHRRASSPVDIPVKFASRNGQHQHQLATPPLTPEDSSNNIRNQPTAGEKDALDFLLSIFPSDGVNILPFARSVTISAPNMEKSFDGAVLKLPGRPKTLYVDGKNAETVSLRESIVTLLDLADDTLQCSALIIALERSSPALGDLLHSLMYVGGTVVTKSPYKVDPAYVLVGLEI